MEALYHFFLVVLRRHIAIYIYNIYIYRSSEVIHHGVVGRTGTGGRFHG